MEFTASCTFTISSWRLNANPSGSILRCVVHGGNKTPKITMDARIRLPRNFHRSLTTCFCFLNSTSATQQWITALQLAQMFAGTILSVLAFVTQIREGDRCWSKPRSNIASLLMYGSYFFLFLQFFFTKYAVRAKTPKKMD